MERKEQCVIQLRKQIDSVTNSFYQQKIQDGYIELISIIDNFTELINIIEDSYSSPKFDEINKNFKRILENMMEAMDKKDTVLIADILNYDISDVLDEIMNNNDR